MRYSEVRNSSEIMYENKFAKIQTITYFHMAYPIYVFLYRVRQIPLFFFGKCLKKKLLNIFPNSFFCLKVQSFRLIMENNFIQMAVSVGHIVAYTIRPIFKHIIDCVQFHHWLHEYCPLKRQLPLTCRRITYL